MKVKLLTAGDALSKSGGKVYRPRKVRLKTGLFRKKILVNNRKENIK